jgi:hypothetical protein
VGKYKPTAEDAERVDAMRAEGLSAGRVAAALNTTTLNLKKYYPDILAKHRAADEERYRAFKAGKGPNPRPKGGRPLGSTNANGCKNSGPTNLRKGNGMGWGGAPSGKPAGGGVPVPFGTPGNDLGRPEGSFVDPETKEWRDEKRRKAMLTYAAVMETGESEMLRLAAADKLLDRMDGKPVGREITTNVATLEDLVAASMQPRPTPPILISESTRLPKTNADEH